MSLGHEPGLVGAVRSLLEQSEPVEVVVVSSGGGDPEARLAAAGIDVPVVSRTERLLPGAARNLGIDATRSRYVSFLAADCIAEPGWVSGRMREHASGADAVASVMANAVPSSASASASHLLLHNRRMPSTAAGDRLLYGLSYDRRLFDRFGRFREDLLVGEDTELNSRFSSDVRVVWAADVRTAHSYATDPVALLREHYRRGRRHVLGLAATDPALAETVPRNVLRNTWRCFRQTTPGDGPRGLRPLLLAAGSAYAAGAAVSVRLSPLIRRTAGGAAPEQV